MSLLNQIERVPVDSLKYHPANPRRGNVDVIAESLDVNQQFAPIVVQKSTRYVLAGNHTLKACQQLGWTEVDVAFVDVDDAAARRIMLAANRTADLGSYDHDALAELLSSLDDDLDGTGYSHEDLEKLLAPADQLPEPGDADTDDDLPNAWGVIVTCTDEAEQAELLHRFTVEGLSVRALSL